MPALVAAVVLLGAVCLLNLLLLFAVLRRLREQTAELARLAAIGPFGKSGYDVGKLIGKAWPAADVPALVGFFAPGCEPCHLEAPTFAAAAAGGERRSPWSPAIRARSARSPNCSATRRPCWSGRTRGG